MTELKRWEIHNKLFLGLLILMAVIAYIDVQQIQTFFTINTQEAWKLYNAHTLPALINLWLVIFGTLAFVYYLFTKDKSESVGLFLAAFIMLFSGVEDVLYYMFSPQPMTQCMQWLNDLNAPVATWARVVFNQTCVSPEALVTMAIASVIASYYLFKAFQKARW